MSQHEEPIEDLAPDAERIVGGDGPIATVTVNDTVLTIDATSTSASANAGQIAVGAEHSDDATSINVKTRD